MKGYVHGVFDTSSFTTFSNRKNNEFQGIKTRHLLDNVGVTQKYFGLKDT